MLANVLADELADDDTQPCPRHTERVHGAPTRRVHLVGPILLCGGLVLAACSSSPAPTHPAGAPPHHPTVTASTPTAPPTAPTLPTTGPLQAGSPVTVPLSAAQIASAEGPDGAVFVAAQDPASPAPGVVWVIDGQGPAAVAEHTQAGVAALAADTSNLYVATYADVTAYDRTTGGQSGHWFLPAVNAANASNDDLVSMAAAGGEVFVLITQGNLVTVYRINPSSSAKPSQVVQGLGAVVGSDGTVYYERADHHLVALSSSGAATVGPVLADAPNGLGGGVQYLNTVAGGAVWVDEPAGQGLDQEWATYNDTSLQQVATFGGTDGESYADTAAGPLVLASPDVRSGCVQGANQAGTWCVSRTDLHGVMTEPLSFPNAVDLIGPQPVVIGQNAANTQVDITRLT